MVVVRNIRTVAVRITKKHDRWWRRGLLAKGINKGSDEMGSIA